MAKSASKIVERRRYIRMGIPVGVSYLVPGGNIVRNAIAKNISADGFRLETADREVRESDILELKLTIPGAANPVHAKSRVVWKKRLSLQDGAPYDIGMEFIEIEEDNKNTFLKFFCDLIYALPGDLDQGK